MKTKKPGIFDRPEFEETYQKFFGKLLDDNRIKIIDTEQIVIALSAKNTIFLIF